MPRLVDAPHPAFAEHPHDRVRLVERRADQIVNIDLPADDLLERLRLGKVYPAERIEWALAHFFQRGNVEALRELTLREVAETIGRSNAGSTRAPGVTGAGGRMMLCLSPSSPRSMLRRASRMAGRLDARWYAVYVETPSEAPARIELASQRRLFDAQQVARDLGAEVHHIKAASVVEGICEFARANGVSDVVVGISRQPWFRRLLGRSIPQRLVEELRDVDLHLLTDAEPIP